jgi:YidC/Oxa1 family membrane protein insertase
MIFASSIIETAFSPLITIFEGLLVFLHGFLGNWGLSIVVMTMVIRAILVPLTYRQLKSMQAMQQLAPELQALKEKYKEDKQRQQQEIMKLYQERGVNPFSSCLPLLLQLPVFFSLFYMLRTRLKKDICGTPMIKSYETALGKHIENFKAIPEHATKITSSMAQAVNGITESGGHMVKGLSEVGCNVVAPGSAKFLFLPDITEKATGVALIVLILLYVGSQLASTLVATATADPTQRRIMLVLPLVFVIILYRYPSGLLLYWITTNLWTIGQQLVIRRRMPPPPKPAASSNGATPKKPSLKETLADAMGSARAEPKPAPAPAVAPSPPARKKKKRSGRRR